jgi:hypothetical protein
MGLSASPYLSGHSKRLVRLFFKLINGTRDEKEPAKHVRWRSELILVRDVYKNYSLLFKIFDLTNRNWHLLYESKFGRLIPE